jgi:hypothetical protein
MYYHTLNPERLFLVGLAVSQDGFQWEKVGQILGPGELGSFDERGIGTRHVLKIDNQYVMFYEGVNQSGYHSIGLAIPMMAFTGKNNQVRKLVDLFLVILLKVLVVGMHRPLVPLVLYRWQMVVFGCIMSVLMKEVTMSYQVSIK